MNLRLTAYLAAVNVAAAPLAVWAIWGSWSGSPQISWLGVGVLILAVLIGELMSLLRSTLPRNSLAVSTAFTTCLLLLAPVGIAIAAQCLALGIDEARQRKALSKVAFNLSTHVLAILAGRGAYVLFTGDDFFVPSRLPDSVLAMCIAAITYLGLTILMVHTAVAVADGSHMLSNLKLDGSLHWGMHTLEVLLVPLAALAVIHSPVLLLVLLLPLLFAVESGQHSNAREHAATHDALTGVLNRGALEQRYAEQQRDAARSGQRVALAMIGLDQFKDINRVLGHDAADEVLRLAAERLRAAVREQDFVARMEGDTFAVLTRLPANNAVADVEALAHRLLQSLREPFLLSGVRIDVQATIGLALADTASTEVRDILRSASAALRDAKAQARGSFRHGTTTVETSSVAQLSMLGDLRTAIDTGQIEVFYQPKVAAASGQVSGVEALVRWQHPEQGLLSPLSFIPLAEHTGLIAPLTWEVLEQSLRQTRVWLDRGWALGVAVNFAAAQIADPTTPDRVAAALLRYGVPSSQLTVEVTEGTLLADTARAVAVLDRLRDLGVRVSIDDYGTGYSSLFYLQQLSVDELKIDRAFVKHLADRSNVKNLALVESSITLGHNLGLAVVAEGVEDQTTLEILSELRCDLIQGYFHSPPKPAAVMTEWLSGQSVQSAPVRPAVAALPQVPPLPTGRTTHSSAGH